MYILFWWNGCDSVACSAAAFFSEFPSEHKRTKGLIIPQLHLELFCQQYVVRSHEIVVLLEWCLRQLELNMWFFFFPAKPFENGQYLDIYGITRDQAGEYECSAENDVSFPDVKKVKVVVNCKSHYLISRNFWEKIKHLEKYSPMCVAVSKEVMFC